MTINTDQLRAEFEAWYATEFEQSNKKPLEAKEWPRLRGKFGDYRHFGYLHGCWKGWQAHAALHSDDAQRYRKLRALAMQRGSLTAFVAIAMLDHLRTDEEFDQRIDAEKIERRGRQPEADGGIEKALRIVSRQAPCAHDNADTSLGNGKVWAACSDCGATFPQDRWAHARSAAKEFEDALATLTTAARQDRFP